MVHDRWELDDLVGALAPQLLEGEFVYVCLPGPRADLAALATVREAEGITYVVTRAEAERLALAFDFAAGWITLSVDSRLEAVGLTASIAASLAGAGISCNVFAGFHHDHLLVPYDRRDEALRLLEELSARARRGDLDAATAERP